MWVKPPIYVIKPPSELGASNQTRCCRISRLPGQSGSQLQPALFGSKSQEMAGKEAPGPCGHRALSLARPSRAEQPHAACGLGPVSPHPGGVVMAWGTRCHPGLAVLQSPRLQVKLNPPHPHSSGQEPLLAPICLFLSISSSLSAFLKPSSFPHSLNRGPCSCAPFLHFISLLYQPGRCWQ